MKRRLLEYLMRRINGDLSLSPVEEILYDFIILLRQRGIITIDTDKLRDELDRDEAAANVLGLYHDKPTVNQEKVSSLALAEYSPLVITKIYFLSLFNYLKNFLRRGN